MWALRRNDGMVASYFACTRGCQKRSQVLTIRRNCYVCAHELRANDHEMDTNYVGFVERAP